MCIFADTKQSAGWEWELGGIIAVDFLEELNKTYANLCRKVKTYLRNISGENGKGISINLAT